MQAAYEFVGNDWPKMDKNHFEVRSLIQDEKATGRYKNLDDLENLEVKGK